MLRSLIYINQVCHREFRVVFSFMAFEYADAVWDKADWDKIYTLSVHLLRQTICSQIDASAAFMGLLKIKGKGAWLMVFLM